MQSLATYVINLDRDTERMARTAAALDAAGLPFERVPAQDGGALDPALGEDARRFMGRALRPGEVGCFASHRVAAQRFLDSGAQFGLVLEDDVALHDTAAEVVDRLCRALPQFTLWDVINLARPVRRWRTPVRPVLWSGAPALFHAHYMPVTTTALMWCRGGAQMFLTMTPRMHYPVDVAIQAWVAETDRGLAFRAPPMSARADDSTIETGQEKRASADREPDYRRLKIARQLATHRAGLRNLLQRRTR